MRITSPKKPYAVVVQQTPEQYHADGGMGFPEKYVLGRFSSYDDAKKHYCALLRDSHMLVNDYTNGMLSIYSYSPTMGDAAFIECTFREDGSIEDNSIFTATSYGSF